MENDSIQSAFLGLTVKSGMPEAKIDLSTVIKETTGPQKVAQIASQGPFRATLKGVLKVSNEAKLVKAIGTFEKNNFKKDPATTIDEIVVRWLGTETVVESTIDGVDIILDHSVEIKPMFSPFLVNVAKFASGEIHYSGQDGVKCVYKLSGGKLTSENV